MNSNQPWLLGREGERIAAGFLEKKGYRIVQRNFRFHRNEIDIIAMDGETVCFIEVKTRSSATKGEPAEAVTPGKQREIARALKPGWHSALKGNRTAGSMSSESLPSPSPEGVFGHEASSFSPMHFMTPEGGENTTYLPDFYYLCIAFYNLQSL